VTLKSISLGIGIFVLAMLATIDPPNRSAAIGGISLGGASAEAGQHEGKRWHHDRHRWKRPPILDTLEDLELDADDDGPDDDVDDGHDDTADDTDD
jgi:hypothetical protein